MIVVDGNPPQRKGDSPLSPEGSPITPRGPPPPAYPGYQPAYQAYQPPFVAVEVRRESAAKRFLKSFVVAILIWALLGILTRSFIELGMDAHRHWSHSGEGWDRNDWPAPQPVLTNPHEHIEKCVQGPSWTPLGPDPSHSYPTRYLAKTEFDLPLDSDTLFLLARGSMSSGSVHVIEDPDVKDKVKVSINVHYYTTTALAQANVCLLHREDREKGIGFFTPKYRRWVSPKDSLRFDVTVHLPSPGASSLYIPGFETDLPLFSQLFGPLNTAFEFGSVSLKSTNAAIEIESILVHQAKMATTNGPIRGVFNTSTALELITTNAFIHADVAMYNNNTGDSTTLFLKTTNGPISTNASLYSSTATGTKGSFKVTAHTTNSPLEVTTGVMPPDAILHLDASTTNSPAHAALHPAYEGTFIVQSTVFTPAVEERHDVEDPSGRGRRRTVDIRAIRNNVVHGSVAWVPSEHESGAAGSVSLKTTNNRARLNL